MTEQSFLAVQNLLHNPLLERAHVMHKILINRGIAQCYAPGRTPLPPTPEPKPNNNPMTSKKKISKASKRKREEKNTGLKHGKKTSCEQKGSELPLDLLTNNQPPRSAKKTSPRSAASKKLQPRYTAPSAATRSSVKPPEDSKAASTVAPMRTATRHAKESVQETKEEAVGSGSRMKKRRNSDD